VGQYIRPVSSDTSKYRCGTRKLAANPGGSDTTVLKVSQTKDFKPRLVETFMLAHGSNYRYWGRMVLAPIGKCHLVFLGLNSLALNDV
jgi:hypothetical protein